MELEIIKKTNSLNITNALEDYIRIYKPFNKYDM